MARKQVEDNVDDRAQLLFKLLVERYLADGSPVASKKLAAFPEVEVSPATVRNIMAELEDRGLVRSPHTSAGKVPTNLGLRFFVDSLLAVQPLGEEQIHRLELELNPDLSPQELVESASNLLSHLTRMTCVVTLPRRDQVALRHVEFLRLSGDRVLVILVLNDREVQNRVIHTDREYEDTELTQAANFINREFGGLSLVSIRDALLSSMQADKDGMDRLMQTALDMAGRVFSESDQPLGKELVIAGMLIAARRKDPFSRVTFIQGNAASLPFADDIFHGVSCSHALYELKGEDRVKALYEMKRVVRKDGIVLIMEHEVPSRPVASFMFRLRLMAMGSADAKEFVESGIKTFQQVFPSVTLHHTPSGRSKLICCHK